MNFEKYIFLTLVFSLLGCGVKNDPIPPSDTAIPSYLEKFTKKNEAKKETKDEKKESGLKDKKD